MKAKCHLNFIPKKSAVKDSHQRRTLGFTGVWPAIAAAATTAFGAHAQAQTVIIQDGFSSGSANYTPLGYSAYSPGTAGQSPTINLPGTTYNPNTAWQAMSGNMSSISNYNSVSDYAIMRDGASIGISLGAYSTGILQTAATVNFYQSPAQVNAYILAGFSNANLANTVSNAGSVSETALNTFTGLTVTESGSLQEYVAGTAVGSPVTWGGSALAGTAGTGFLGGSDGATSGTLTYDLNTATGAITDVSFSISGYGTNTANYSQFAMLPVGFTNADVIDNEIGAFSSSSGSGYNAGQMYSYKLSGIAVPEPATCATALCGVGMLLGLRRFRGRRG